MIIWSGFGPLTFLFGGLGFAVAAVLHQTAILQQAQMRRYARLPHVGNLLKFIDRQFVGFQQRHDAQSRRVRQRAQELERGTHPRQLRAGAGFA